MVKNKGVEFKHDRLLSLIEANRMTVPEVAGKLNVTRQLVYRWVSGQSIPGMKAMIRLCALFNVDMNFFFSSTRKNKLEAELA